MELGLVYPGKMARSTRSRLRERGLETLGYPYAADSLATLVEALPSPRAVWVLMPAGPSTRRVIDDLSRLLSPGDLVVDGGNSAGTEGADVLARGGIRLLECGFSDRVWERHVGYALMAGDGAVECGSIPTYLQQNRTLPADDLIMDIPAVMRAWSKDTAAQSWLLDLLVHALSGNLDPVTTSGYVEHPGEGMWSVDEAITHGVSAPVISAALFARFASRLSHSQAMKAVSDLRNRPDQNRTRLAQRVATV
ncbi:NAD(P)-binding domain-containing protein [Rhodococcoides trifolii]|uniref:NAD(P)-binding domain-containing protein n=1 Tax=Rhodococcoides trifolii TaxID=908250 RepID=UPI00166E9116|nr:NAD(P)-binding domain-containing protein [Rhodococcus trifolii]